MKVRCWVMVGSEQVASDLRQEMFRGDYRGDPSNAAMYNVGEWIIWQPAPGEIRLVLVCVEIPL